MRSRSLRSARSPAGSGRWLPLGATIALTLTVGAMVSAQEVRRADHQPIDDGAFSVVTQFFDFDTGIGLEARTVDRWKAPWANQEKVVFTAGDLDRVPGIFGRPPGAEERLPVVLLLHGLGEDKRSWWLEPSGVRLTRTLLEAGVAVFAIDLRFHGERASANDYEPAMYLTMEGQRFVRSRDMMIDSAIDARRALQYLRSRSDVDASRICVAGQSMGGMIAVMLGALEPTLACIGGASVPSHPQLLPTDHYNFASRARLPTLLVAGEADWHTSADDSRHLLELFPTTHKRLLLDEGGHALTAERAVALAEWMSDVLRSGTGTALNE